MMNLRKILNKQDLILFMFYFVFISTGLRHLIGALYTIFPIAIIIYLVLFNGFTISKKFLFYLFIFTIPVYATLFDSDITSKSYAIGRYLFCLIGIIPFHLKRNRLSIEKYENFFSYIVIVGGISLLYQVIYGPISWLAEAGERIGLSRFSTIMGSITVFSVSQPIALGIILKNFDGLKRTSLTILLVFLGLLSISKTAIAGTLMVFCIFLVLNLKINLKYFLKSFSGIFIGLVFFLLIIDSLEGTIVYDYYQNIIQYSQVIFGLQGKALGADQSESLSGNSNIRFQEYAIPLMTQLWNDLGILGFICGGGLKFMGNAVLPMSDKNLDMSHVNYFDFLLTGGFLMLIPCSFLMVKAIVVDFFKKRFDNLPIYIYIILVLFTTSSFHFHPSTSVIFYLYFFYNLR